MLSAGRADAEAAKARFSTYSSGAAQVYNHPVPDFASFFGALELVPPGVVDAREWRPGWEQAVRLAPRDGQAIVGVAWVGLGQLAPVTPADVSAVQREHDPAPETAGCDPLVSRCHLLQRGQVPPQADVSAGCHQAVLGEPASAGGDVDRVDRCRVHPDSHLPGAGLRDRDVG